MNTKKISRKTPHWSTLTALGAVTVAPLLGAPHAVEAAPAVRYAQAPRQIVSVSGVVTQDLAGREFRMRASNGREFRVIIDRGHEPQALSRNDRVTVRGYFTSGLFIANSLSITRNQPAGGYRPGSTQSGSVSGVVTQDLAGREFRMRANDGREFRVVIDRGREPQALTRNDRVTVNGYFTSGLFIAHSLTITRNQPAWGNRPGWSKQSSVSGIVTQDLAGREFRMRANDGREFRVIIDRGHEPRALSRNDRVTVRGYFSSGLFIAHSLTITQNRPVWGQGSHYGQGRVDLTGTVITKTSSTRYGIHATNGVNYAIQARRSPATTVGIGDVIRVIGWHSGSTITADRILMVRNVRNNTWNTWPNQTMRSGQAVNFSGTVIRITRVFGLAGDLLVRAGNGRDYRVRSTNVTNFRVGNRVHVVGTYNNGAVNASSVTRI